MPVHQLGDGMLDLDAAVDLDEVGVALGVDQELERAQVLVAGRGHGLDGPLGELLAGGVGERRAGRLLDQLLVAPLDRAVALAHVDGVAEAVDRDLDLDVAVVVEVLLQVQRVVAEAGLGLGAADLEGATPARAAVRTRRMPLPPPPADGLIRTG